MWMHCLNPFSQWDSPWDEMPKISPDQPIMSHTTSLYPNSRPWAFELNTGMKSFSQHKTPQFTGSALSLTINSLHPALIFKADPWRRPLTPTVPLFFLYWGDSSLSQTEIKARMQSIQCFNLNHAELQVAQLWKKRRKKKVLL